MNTKNYFLKTLFLTLIIYCINTSVYSQTTIYTNDMDYVIGDTKQAFITGAITTETQADNLLKGFKNLKVNGIRIPIFPRDEDTGVSLNPEPEMMKYFYEQALAQGFLIFANPAQGGGGARIANNDLSEEGGVNGVQAATDELIARMLEFSAEYPNCKWLNPFNEDGRATSSTWSVDQYHTIYAALYNNVNGAELVGPCTWGLGAGIDMLQNTNISDYITVATSHNLGFEHGKWPTFINLAKADDLPVWDSEVNHSDKYGTGTRLEKAIENKVDGLVLYDIWKNISLTDGYINSGGQDMMILYLKDYTIPVGIAVDGVATQSETTTPQWYVEASVAIDGNTNGHWSGGNGSVTHTSGENPWWQVDLGSDKKIGEIIIHNRTDANPQNLSNFTVTVTNTIGSKVFTKTYADYPDPRLIIETGTISGGVVKVQKNDTGTLTLAEVQVFAPDESLSTEIFDNINVKIYPNPVADVFTISAAVSTFNQYEVYNINGQRILSDSVPSNTREIEVNLTNFSRGIYMIKLNGVQFSKTYKIVKE